jgi:hypothetical protein
MYPYLQDHTPEYAEFIEEYNCFLKHYAEFQIFCKKTHIHTPIGTEDFLLYTQAVEAHIAATNAYIRLVAIYERLLLKYCHNVHM